MAVLAAVGGVSFLLLCIVGGARLLLLARRTRELPEFVLGMGLFLMGGVATPMAGVARAPLGLSEVTSAVLLVGHSVIMAAGMAGFAQFTRWVFRPQEGWALLLSLALPVGMLVSIPAMLLLDSSILAHVNNAGPGYMLQQTCVFVTLGWAGFESLRYSAVLKRRLKLGLADPVVFDRVRLWGVAMALATLMSVVTVGGQFVGIDVLASMGGAAFIGCVGFVAGSAIYLALLPPRAYTRWIHARWSAQGL